MRPKKLASLILAILIRANVAEDAFSSSLTFCIKTSVFLSLSKYILLKVGRTSVQIYNFHYVTLDAIKQKHQIVG